MKILEYDEVDGQQVLELNLIAFGWFLSPEQVRIIRKVDNTRVPNYFALYAVEKEKVLGQVGVVTVDTKTSFGTEKIGFIWGVCTRPKYARRGYAKKLMNEAHERLAHEDIRYSFLGTGKSMVAYGLYDQLGYKDFLTFNRRLKACNKTEQKGLDVTYSSSIRNEIIVELFTKYSKDLLGFVKRPDNFLDVRKAWSWMPYNLIGAFKEGNKSIGYIVASTEGKIVRIRELCCPKIADIGKCIAAFENKFKPDYVLLDGIISSFQGNVYIKSGFKLFTGSWGILMVKDLDDKHSIKQIRNIYGVEEEKFSMTPIDEY
ncbi:MAG: GNAT family N-acetyltransferase [Thermoplasmata archaeon]|nr:MAG: GNAT family N-acetyltransferase [Thermoplasmata archaeon]